MGLLLLLLWLPSVYLTREQVSTIHHSVAHAHLMSFICCLHRMYYFILVFRTNDWNPVCYLIIWVPITTTTTTTFANTCLVKRNFSPFLLFFLWSRWYLSLGMKWTWNGYYYCCEKDLRRNNISKIKFLLCWVSGDIKIFNACAENHMLKYTFPIALSPGKEQQKILLHVCCILIK